MSISYESYKHVVLDASSLLYPFPADLIEYLESHTVLIAQTFFSEQGAYDILIPKSKRGVFQENRKLLDGKTEIAPMFREEHYVRTGLSCDILGLVQLLSLSSVSHTASGCRCLLVTADLSLLEQLSTYSVPVDIRFLPEDRLFTKEDEEALRMRFDYEQQKADRAAPKKEPRPVRRKSSITVYTKDHKPRTLARIMDAVSSSIYIYENTEQTFYAKIFSKSRLSDEKMEHVRALADFNKAQDYELDWVLLPIAELYSDQEATNPVGYLMPKAKNKHDINTALPFHPHYWKSYKTIPYYEYLYLARMFVRQSLYLKIYNICPSDYNPGNFSLYSARDIKGSMPSGHRWLYMWDTDSFCWNSYTSNRWWDDRHPTQGSGSTYAETCANALYQCVFAILTWSEQPYTQILYPGANATVRQEPPVFGFDEKLPQARTRYFYLPEGLRRLFHDVLVCHRPPSVPALLHELELACKERQYTDESLEKVHQAAKEKAESGEDFRPRRRRAIPPLPQMPQVPEISVPLSIWSEYTEAFRATRCQGTPDPNTTPSK